MNENEYWVAVWRTFAAALCVIAMTVAGCDSYRTNAITSHHDPIAARCGIGGGGDSGRDIAMCLEKAKK